MKKKITIVTTIVIIMLVFFLIMNFKKNNISRNENPASNINIENVEEDVFEIYLKNIEDFSELSADQVSEKNNNNNSFFLYFGRGSCPYCRDFVPKLNKESDKRKIEINYLNTENTDTDVDIQNLRKKYNVEFVPTLMYISDNGESAKTFNEKNENLSEFLESNVNTD